jgi:hypothetical protein
MAGITAIIQHQVRVPARAVQPALDSRLSFLQNRSHHVLGNLAVGVGRCGRDIRFMIQAISQLTIRSAHVTAQCVSTGRLVL